MTITLTWDPFEVVTHDGVPLPRILHHGAHALIGLAVLLLTHPVHAPLWLVLVLAALAAWYDKHTWFDWHLSSGRFFHPWVPYTLNLPDFVGDAAFTLMGATALFWVASWQHGLFAAAIYYPLSLVNDP